MPCRGALVQEEASVMPGAGTRAQSVYSVSVLGASSTHREFCPCHCPVALPQVIFETFAWDLSNNQDGRYPRWLDPKVPPRCYCAVTQ